MEFSCGCAVAVLLYVGRHRHATAYSFRMCIVAVHASPSWFIVIGMFADDVVDCTESLWVCCYIFLGVHIPQLIACVRVRVTARAHAFCVFVTSLEKRASRCDSMPSGHTEKRADANK